MEGRLWRQYNFFLLGCVLVLLSIGLLSVYSATLNTVAASGSPMSVLFPRHLIHITLGLIAMGLIAVFDYRLLSSLALPLYLGTLAILGVVLFMGEITSGAQSWITIGVLSFQPSELAKLLIIIVLAAYWARFEEQRAHWLVQLGSLVLVGMPMLMIIAQPDLGTGMVVGTIWLAMAWGAGVRWHQLLLLGMLAVPVALVGWSFVLDTEQQSRLLTFYWLLNDPARVDPNDGYNVIQSLKAIGSGGLFGAGLTHGLLSQGNYIPVQYSDFIFAVIGEEMGFMGGGVVLAFQGLLLWLVLSVAAEARDLLGRLIALGVFGLLFSHVVINIGMSMSVLPVTGLPLPFISYGGSFTITTLLAIGLLQNVRMRRRKILF